MTQQPTFNLVDEPWIEVLTVAGKAQAVSVRDAFRRSADIRRLAGELPTQDAAVLRLLLAILYRALPVSDGDEEGITEVWGEWWRERALPLAQVDDYLDAWKDRFDLLDPERPFFQVADLETGTGRWSGVHKLIADLPSRSHRRLFSNRAAHEARALSFAEAARWVVHCQSYDVSGVKTGALGDPRVKDGKAHPKSPGWAGNLGLVILEGDTLQETLLLNFVLTAPSGDEDRPPWEVDGWSAKSSEEGSPTGPAQAMTWQARRLRLRVEHGEVRDALISHGDQIRLRNQDAVEPMSGWRQSVAQQKQHKESFAYMPRAHLKERSIWRGLNAVLTGDAINVGSSVAAKSQRAGTLSWLALLETNGRVESEESISLHTVGIEYGSNNSTIDAVLSDRLDIRAEVAQDTALQEAAVRAVRVVEQAAYLLGRLADNLAKAEGRDRADDQDRRRELTYQQLDQPFRQWLADLSSGNVADKAPAWVDRVRAEALATAQGLYAASSPRAIKGRVVTDRNGKSLRLDAAQAHGWFRSQLDKEVPAPEPAAHAQPEERTA